MSQVKHGLAMAGEHRVPDTGGSLRKFNRDLLEILPCEGKYSFWHGYEYNCAVTYSQNVCPPVKLWQESVKIEKLVMLQGCVKKKKSGKQQVWSLAWVSTVWKGSVPLLMCQSPGWSSGSPTGALLAAFSGGEGGWTAAACGVQEFRVNNRTVSWPETPWICEGFNLLLMGALVLWRCSSLPRQFQPLGLFATIICIYKKSEVPPVLCLKW